MSSVTDSYHGADRVSVDAGRDLNGRPDPECVLSWRSLAAVGLVVALAKWLFAADRRIFHVYHDEPGQLAMARWLSGRQPWSLFDLDTWQPGYALLIAPLYAVTDDVTTVFRLAIGLNAVLGGLSAVLLALLARRLTDVPGGVCCGIAVVASVLPASLSASALTWSEPLLTLVFSAAVLVTMRYLDGGAFGTGAVAIALSGAGALTHGRLLPLFVIVTAIVVVHGFRIDLWRGFAAGGTAAVSLICVLVVTSFVHAGVWDQPGDANSIGTTLGRLSDPVAVMESVLGQVWYQLVTTLMVVGFGIAVLVRRATAPFGPGTARRRDARVVLAMTVPLVAVSVVFMAQAGRPDFAIYGRYNDAVTGPVLVVGFAWLWQARSHARRHLVATIAACAAVTCIAALVVEARNGDDLAADLGLREMIAGVLPFVGRGESLAPISVTAVALAVAALLVGARLVPSKRSDSLLAAVLVVVLVSGAVRTFVAFQPSLNSFESAAEVRAVRGLVPPGTEIGVHFVGPDAPSWVTTNAQRRAALLYQAYLPEYRFVRDNGIDDATGPYVFAPRRDPGLTAAGAVELWVAEDSGMALWREPVSP